MDRAAVIANTRGLTPAKLDVLGGVGPVESYRAVPARWMLEDVPLQVTTSTSIIPTRYKLVLNGFSNTVPRRMELRDASGTVLGNTVVDTPDQNYTIDNLSLPPGRSRLSLHMEPGAGRLGNSNRFGSVYLIQLRFETLPYIDPRPMPSR